MIRKHKLILNGREVTPEEFHKDGPVGGRGIPMVARTYTDANPLVSESLGCLPNQIPLMKKAIKKHSIPGVKVNPNGSLAITSRAGRAKLMGIKDQHDNDGGYGDG